MDHHPRHDHASFLLRLWRAKSSEWFASLEDTATGERKGFASLDLLMKFLQSLTDENESNGDLDETNTRLPPDR